jgi:hypothetical protein
MTVILVLAGVFIILTFIFPTKSNQLNKKLTNEELEIQRDVERDEEIRHKMESGKWDFEEDEYDSDSYGPCTDD